MPKWTRWLVISVLAVVLDQWSKAWALQHLVFAQPVAVLPSFNLMLLYNTGAAFSFLAAAGGWQKLFFVGIALAAVVIIPWVMRRNAQSTLMCLALSAILGGTLGNLIDRLRLGHVVDFLDVYYGNWHWPAFNIADSFITVGAILLVLDSMRRPETPAADREAGA
jgi:signal peptidase II